MKNLIRILMLLPKRFYLGILFRMDGVRHARAIGVKCGQRCFFSHVNFGSEPFLITIGDHVAIAKATFITHDGGAWVLRDKHPNIEILEPIKIGNNVLIGYGTILMPGVTIGDNCVIGAGAVITKDIPSNSVAVGVPAKVIKSIDQYYDSIKDKATYIKNLPLKEKEKILKQKFFGKNPRE